jgi:hypothetical protein
MAAKGKGPSRLVGLMERAGAAAPTEAKAKAPDEGPEALFITTYRVKRRHHAALKREALERQLAGREGQDDASAVLRDFMDECLEKWLEDNR